MKKVFKWLRLLPVSISFILIMIVLNIVLCTQPVIGTYRGTTQEDYVGTITHTVSFKNGYMTHTMTGLSYGEKITAYQMGCYMRIDDEIRVALFYDVDNRPEGGNVQVIRRTFIRKNVFKISYNGSDFYSKTAIMLQVGIGVMYVVGLSFFCIGIIDRRNEKQN